MGKRGSGMEDQNKFLERLEAVKEIAGAHHHYLTKQEIREYLDGITLTEEQWQSVYQYLGANHIQVEGYQYVPEELSGQEITEPDAGAERSEKNRYLYQKDLQQLPSDRMEIPMQEIRCFLQGDQQYRAKIIESRLRQVVGIAERYQGHSVPEDELVAEGNLGLLCGMQQIEKEPGKYLLPDGSVDIQAFYRVLEREVIRAVEQMVDRENASRDQESAMLAKTNLLHEAAKYMTEEIGRVPTVSELSEYTGVSQKEIRQIMGLSEDAKRVASPEVPS